MTINKNIIKFNLVYFWIYMLILRKKGEKMKLVEYISHLTSIDKIYYILIIYIEKDSQKL